MSDDKLLKMGEYPVEAGPYKETWGSLQNYKCPEWFRDAKLGMWAHWGPQAVPGAGDWYARNIYIEGHEQYKYHLKNYGHPSQFGFKDIAKLWKAENFDPDALMKLYKKAGAKYFTALAVHHDNFDCWDSAYTQYNSTKIGPIKDIVGMWKKAADKHGLKFGVTEHLERSYNWFNTNKGSDSEGEYKGVPYDGNDPEFEDYYFPRHDDDNHAYPVNPPEWWQWQWYARVKDLLDKYEPDLLYTDGAIPFGEVGLKMLANFYNSNIKWNNGEFEAIYALKDMRGYDREHGVSHGEYVEGIGVQDMERGVISGINPVPWQTDTCIGTWYYNKFIEYKTTKQIIHMLIDIVSKNGNLLLNFPLKPDGTLDDGSMDVLKGLGDWMDVNSQAIYETRPFDVYGEGGVNASGGLFNEDAIDYTSADYRFTKKGNTLYATMLAWPVEGKTGVTTLVKEKYKVSSVVMLGSDESINWNQDNYGLHIDGLKSKPCDNAYVFKIEIE